MPKKAWATSRTIADCEIRFSAVEGDLSILKWMVGSLLAISLTTLGSTIAVLFRVIEGIR